MYLNDSTTELSDTQRIYYKALSQSTNSVEDQRIALKGLEKASKSASKAQTLLNAALSAAVVFVVAETIKALIMREKELAEQARQATDAFNQQKQTITDYASRIDELYTKINSGQLTLDEHVEANRELRTIQQELIDNFGDEAKGIDLVTTSIEKQNEALEKVNSLKQSEYLKSEWANTINKETDSDKWLNGLWTASNVIATTFGSSAAIENWRNGEATDYRKAFGLGTHLDEMNREYEQFSGKIEATSDDMFNHIIESYNNVRKTTSGDFEIFGNVDQVKETIIHLQNDYKNFPGYTDAWAESLGKVWNKADDIVQKYGEAYQAQILMNVASNEQYVQWQEELQKIYDEYEKATIENDETKAEEAARKYKDLVNQIRQEVGSETYQNAIINVVPAIADVDYLNFEQQIEGIMDSEEYKQFEKLNIPVEFDANAINLYHLLETIYNENAEGLRKFGIKSYEEYINGLAEAAEKGSNNVTSVLYRYGALEPSNRAAVINASRGENGSYGSYSGRHHADGSRFITSTDYAKVAEYKDQLLKLYQLSDDAIEEAENAAIILNNLSLKYGESFTSLLSVILSKDEKLDWYDWINVEGFEGALESLKNDTDLEEWQIKEILTNLGLIESDTRREITNQIENFLKESFGDVELSDSERYLADVLVDALMNTWDEEELQNLPFIWKHLQVPSGVVPSLDKMNDALERFNETLKDTEEESKNLRFAFDAVDSLAETESAINSLNELYWETVKKDPNADEDALANWGIADPAKINAVEQAFTKLAEKEDEVTQEKLSLALKDFEETLVHFPGDAEKAENAINELITTYINESSILDDLTEENQEYIKARLESIGISNAEEVVQSRLTGTVKATTTAIKELRDEYNKYYETINSADPNTEEYKKAIDDLTSYVSKAIAFYDEDGNISKLFEVSSDFVQNHWDTIQKMLDGDEEALRELQKYAAKTELSTVMNITLPEEAMNSFFDDLWDKIDWANLQEIEIGADLNNEAFISALNQMANGSWEIAEQIANYFKAIGIDLKMNRQYGKTGANGMSSEAAKYMDARGPFAGATKSADSGLGSQAKYNPKPASAKDKGGGSDKEEEDPIIKDFEEKLQRLQWLQENGKDIAVCYSNVA